MRTDGNNNGYFQKVGEWRHYESDIFDFLYESVVVKKIKDLDLVEKQNIIPGASYFTKILSDNLFDRQLYFERLGKIVKSYDLVFFDPDNGIAIPSVIKGRKNSSKYIYWDEMEDIWKRGLSLLVYQHFPRVNRLKYINNIFEQIKEKLKVGEIYAIKTTHMVYFLLLQDKHKINFLVLKKKITSKWDNIIEVVHYSRAVMV